MDKTYNIVELFSGIGSQAKALKNLDVKVNTLATCEWDVHAIVAYDRIHTSTELPDDVADMSKEDVLEKLKTYKFSNSGKEALEFKSLRTYSVDALRSIYASVVRNKNFVDVSALQGALMPEGIDILTYSFPCQDLSNVGAFHGYNKGIDRESGSRSSLLWQVGRILTEMRKAKVTLPRFLLMENVPTLLSERHKPNFDIWISDLKKLGYASKYFLLNASEFGIPQNRPRLLMISVFVGSNNERKQQISKYFDSIDSDGVIADYQKSKYYKEMTVWSLLRTDYRKKTLKSEAIECTPNDTVSRRKIWKDNPKIIKGRGQRNNRIKVIRTITTKQDRNPNSGNLYFESGIKGKSKFRYLTPRECMLFMGFSDTDYENIKSKPIMFHKGDELFARDKVIRMAGNSIPVKLLEGVFWQILKIDKLMGDDQ